MSGPLQLIDVARIVRQLITAADDAGLSVRDDNVMQLLCENIATRVSESDIRSALVVAGLAARFPETTSARAYWGRA